jgi:sulfate adenylyltransferase
MMQRTKWRDKISVTRRATSVDDPTASGAPTGLIAPYGGRLVDLSAGEEERREASARAARLPSIQLSSRSLCDLELLATGALSPLDRFMGRADYLRVVEEMRLSGGLLFPMPITLPVADARGLAEGTEVALRTPNNDVVALMRLEEIYGWDLSHEARHVLGTTDVRHPLVAEMHAWGTTYVSGALTVVALPRHQDFADLRHTPARVRAALAATGFGRVVAFQTRHPLHRVHEEMTKRAAGAIEGALLIHPTVGMTRPGDVDHYARIRSYRLLVSRYYDPSRTVLNLAPIAMRMGGPREAIWHAIIHRNHGASHFIVGRHHADPGAASAGEPFYGRREAQAWLERHESETGVTMVPFTDLVYLPREDRYEASDRVRPGVETAAISEAEVRDDYLAKGQPLPGWFTRPETAAILSQVSPPRAKQGFCLWFTGLSGAGKSSIADAVMVMLLERGRSVTVLDGDVVRTHLSRGLGFSKEDRDTNIRRIGFVAAEIVRHNGAVICAAVSPYEATRNECRAMVGDDRFVLAYVDTPLEVCEQRDTKGMYAKARRGEIRGFTGIDDPYERPANPEMVLTTTECTPEDNARTVIAHLVKLGFLADGADGAPRGG